MEVLDAERRLLRSDEGGGAIRSWRHGITVEPTGPERCQYRDVITIDAGALTPLLAAFAEAFYRVSASAGGDAWHPSSPPWPVATSRFRARAVESGAAGRLRTATASSLGVARVSWPRPVQVAGGRTDWAGVSAGCRHTGARRVGVRLYCWGVDANGQLGDGGINTDQPVPVEVLL